MKAKVLGAIGFRVHKSAKLKEFVIVKLRKDFKRKSGMNEFCMYHRYKRQNINPSPMNRSWILQTRGIVLQSREIEK